MFKIIFLEVSYFLAIQGLKKIESYFNFCNISVQVPLSSYELNMHKLSTVKLNF